jgi:hypothetical protein
MGEAEGSKGGLVQEGGTSSWRAAGERGPVAKRDEGLGETEGVSPGAICSPC